MYIVSHNIGPSMKFLPDMAIADHPVVADSFGENPLHDLLQWL